MNRTSVVKLSGLVVPFLVLTCAGCYDVKLPQTLKVQMPDEQTVQAPIRSGPEQMANSTWAMYDRDAVRADGQSEGGAVEPLVRIEFGDVGQIVRAFDNREFAPDKIGTVIVADGRVHDTLLPAATYVAQSYGDSTGAEFGFTAFGRFLAGPLAVARVTVYAFGTLDNHGDRFEGTLGWSLEVEPGVEELLAGVVRSEAEERAILAIRE